MNENEIMVVDADEEVETEVTTDNGGDLGKGVLIGAGVVGAGFALYKLGKKVFTKFKKQPKEVELQATEQSNDDDYVVVDEEKPNKKKN